MFDQIFDAIEEWMRELLTGMINSNLDQIEDSGIPSLRCLSHLPGYGSHLLIDRREHVIQTGLDKPDQDILYRFRNSLNDGVHLPLLLREQCCQLWNQGSSQQHDSGTSHQLFDALALSTG